MSRLSKREFPADSAIDYMSESLKLGSFLLDNPAVSGFVPLGAIVKQALNMGKAPGPNLHKELLQIKDQLTKVSFFLKKILLLYYILNS